MPLRTRRYANEREVVLAALGVASLFCLALEGLREVYFDARGYRFMLWNLVLAWVPLVLGLGLYDRYRRGASLVRLAPWALLWVLFLPNAPYMVTDFVHLSPNARPPLWFDGILFSGFAWTGLLLGFVSIYLVHAVARHRYGPRLAWYGVISLFALVSVGVGLGRFLRWNSWGVILRPGRHAEQFLKHLSDPGTVARGLILTVVLTFLLTAAYFSFYQLVGIRLSADEPQRLPGR